MIPSAHTKAMWSCGGDGRTCRVTTGLAAGRHHHQFRDLRFVVLIGLAASALLLATPSGAAPPQPGVTVLVHGFMALGGQFSSPYDYWGGDKGTNLTALLERFGSGLVWEYNQDTGTFSNITHAQNPDDSYRIPRGNWGPAFAGHQILLFAGAGAATTRRRARRRRPPMRSLPS